MVELLTAFGNAFEASLALALPAALLWGLLSVILSPCHLSSIPLVVAYMSDDEVPTGRAALLLSTSFALGILASIAAVGAATVLLGRIAGDVGPVGSYAMAAVFFAMGLNLLGLLPLPSWGVPDGARRGPLGALLLGLVLGAALGPCTFAFMAPLLGLAFRASGADGARGALLVAAYAVGHALAVALAGASAHAVQRWLTWKAGARAAVLLRLLAGAAVVAGGAYFVSTAT